MTDARLAAPPHWSAQRERGNLLLMRFTAFVARRCGRRLLSPLLHLIVLYFFLTGRRARHSIREYLERLADWSGRSELRPDTRRVFAQFMAFADCLLDRLDVWRGALRLDEVRIVDPDGVRAQLLASRDGGRGQLLVGTHLGNLDVCRALAERGEQVPLNVLVHTHHVAHLNRLLGEAGEQRLRLIQVDELDAALMLDLAQRLDRGEWLAMAGDRVPLHEGRRVMADFMGRPAPFAQGPWLLAGLLGCPVNLMCCIKRAGHHEIHLQRFLDAPAWRRGERDAAIARCAQRYAEQLAQWCLLAPQQWFNFYAYWEPAHAR